MKDCAVGITNKSQSSTVWSQLFETNYKWSLTLEINLYMRNVFDTDVNSYFNVTLQ